MESSKNANYLILAFVFLIIGVALLGSVATSTNERTSKTDVTGESTDLEALGCIWATSNDGQVNESNALCNITVTYPPTNWKVQDCPLTSVTVRNSTTDFTAATDYNLFAASGVVQMLNTSDTHTGFANTTLVDYTYCTDDYLNSTWGRAVLNTVPGFFALALLGVSLWLFYAVFRDNKIMS